MRANRRIAASENYDSDKYVDNYLSVKETNESSKDQSVEALLTKQPPQDR